MILQKLYQLYDRLEKDRSYDIAPEGYSLVAVSFVIVLESDGSWVIEDHRIGEGKNKRGQDHRVPGPKKHSNKVAPFLLRDTSAYLLGKSTGDTSDENVRKRFEASRDFHLSLESDIASEAFRAVCNFFRNWNPETGEVDKSLLSNSGVFKFRTDPQLFLHERPEIQAWWKNSQLKQAPANEEGLCLVTGKFAPIASTHTPSIGGSIPGAQNAATLVSFNFSAADSFGNNNLQGLNAPVSVDAAIRYCKALNAIMSDRRHSLQTAKGNPLLIGDAYTVFWTEKQTDLEPSLMRFFSGTIGTRDSPEEQAQDQALLDALRSFLTAIGSVSMPRTPIHDAATPFHILGLTAQAGGRIGVRFWNTGTLDELIQRLAKHHNDLSIVPEWDETAKHPDPRFPAVWQLLDQVVPLKKGRPNRDKIPPLLGGELMRAILTGKKYPTHLLNAVLARIKTVERESKQRSRRVNYLRAAILKAYLNRNHGINMTEALDPNRKEPAYHLGRLFAVYETAQKHAHDWKLERTIRETMYSAASATPLSVFGRLERLHHHHTAKRSHPPGSSDSYAEIVAKIQQRFTETPLYPASMNLIEQSLFAVGYYHQLHFLRSLSDEIKNADGDDE